MFTSRLATRQTLYRLDAYKRMIDVSDGLIGNGLISTIAASLGNVEREQLRSSIFEHSQFKRSRKE
jgi:hypothetical protein